MNGLALCSGVGGLELGLRIATRGNFRVVCHVEREAYAAAALVARMEDQAVDQAPIWDDLTTFDGRPWRGLVDCVTAGIPCQPYSLAGKRLGHADERALWPELVRIVRQCEPAFVFLENTPDFLHHFGPVWSELWSMGFELAPPLLQTASEFGGPHERERIFILAAHPARQRWQQGWSKSEGIEGGFDDDLVRGDAPDADGSAIRLESRRRGRSSRRDPAIDRDVDDISSDPAFQPTPSARAELRKGRSARCGGESLAYSDSLGLEVEWSGWVFDRERQTLRHDIDRCGPGCRICGSHWETESPPVRVDSGFSGRVDELRAVGNAVIPAVAAAAWTYLVNRLPFTSFCKQTDR